MYKLLNVFLNICLLRAGPQDVPAASVVLALTVAAYMVVGTLVALANYSVGQAVLWSLLDTLLLAVFTYFSLRWRRHVPRFVQTFSALTGTGVLLSMVTWPLLMLLYRQPEGESAAALPSLLLVVLMFWGMAVIAHILRNALSSSFAVGVLLALGYVLVSWKLNAFLFPVAN